MVHRGAAPLTEEEIQLPRTLAERGDFEQGHGTLDARSPRDDYFTTVGGMIRLGRRLTVVVDAGNGVAGLYAPELLRRIGCGVVELHCESRSEEHTSELQSRPHLVCRLLLGKKNIYYLARNLAAD